MPGSYLIYVYEDIKENGSPERGALRPDMLLLPPIFINRLPWTKGYFHTVAHWPLRAHDLLPRHCFSHFSGKYVDENGENLPGPTEPCGEWVLMSYRMLDDLVSDAVGIPRAPEDPDSE
jgi:hypothetical protein